jgi:signal transduction histidine kinase
VSHASTLELVARLAAAAKRREAAAALAERLGVEAFLLFVRDAQLSILLPAPGFPQTLPGGRSWRELLNRCKVPGHHTGEVAVSSSDDPQTRRAEAWVAADGTAVVLLGGSPIESELAVVHTALPLLAAALKGEQIAAAAAGQVEVALDAERHALSLAMALDATRADLERAIAEAARLGRERAIAAEDLQKKSEDALRRAQETAQLREQFIAILGHDLRSPLGSIVLTSQRLIESKRTPDEVIKPVQRILRSANRIGRMVDDLLDFARTRLGGGMPITPAPIADLASFFGNLVEEIGTAHPGRRIALDVEPATSAAWDPDRIAQVLSNLIGNALMHSPADTEVRVSAHGERDSVLVKIHNLGSPIAPELLGKIFEPFQRGQGADTGVKSGLGLGLYITETIVKAHRGAIMVSSSSEEGTTFTLRLPREVETSPAQLHLRN